jgi:hypothetical protein
LHFFLGLLCWFINGPFSQSCHCSAINSLGR